MNLEILNTKYIMFKLEELLFLFKCGEHVFLYTIVPYLDRYRPKDRIIVGHPATSYFLLIIIIRLSLILTFYFFYYFFINLILFLIKICGLNIDLY